MLLSGCVTASGKLIDSNNLELYKNINEEMLLYKGQAAIYLNVSITSVGTPPSMKILINDNEVKLSIPRWSAGRSNYNVHIYSIGNTYYSSVNETNLYSNSIPLSKEAIEAILNANTLEVNYYVGKTKLYDVNLTRVLPKIKDFLK